MLSAEHRALAIGEFRLGSVTLNDCSDDRAARLVRKTALSGSALAVHLCNAYTLTLSDRDPAYAASLGGASLNLVDGTPVTWYYRALTGRRAQGPVRGPSFMRRMLDEPGIKHFLYGGTADVLAGLRATIQEEHPCADLVGAIAPPFAPLQEHEFTRLAAALKETKAQIVWVGLGTPKQDYLVQRLAAETGVVAIGVGAAFDFLSGHKREAPALLHRSGFEWTHRLATEPRRLWRRYLVGNVVFVRMALRGLREHRKQH